jgi:hypothetical protein
MLMRPIADLVDELLASDKTLEGLPTWRQGTREHDRRLAWTILVGGETSRCELTATAYPDESPDRFTIGLNYAGRCVWRLDHELPDWGTHYNPLDRVALLGGEYEIRGRHFHSWQDNRYLATRATLPAELLCARTFAPPPRRGRVPFVGFAGRLGLSNPSISLLSHREGGSCDAGRLC